MLFRLANSSLYTHMPRPEALLLGQHLFDLVLFFFVAFLRLINCKIKILGSLVVIYATRGLFLTQLVHHAHVAWCKRSAILSCAAFTLWPMVLSMDPVAVELSPLSGRDASGRRKASNSGDTRKRCKSGPNRRGKKRSNDDDDDGGSDVESGQPGHMIKFWACFYYRLDPHRHIECGMYKFKRFSDLIDHLFRVHTLMNQAYCPNCWRTLRHIRQRNRHARTCQDVRPREKFYQVEIEGLLSRMHVPAVNLRSLLGGCLPESLKLGELRWLYVWYQFFSEEPPVSFYIQNLIHDIAGLLRRQNEASLHHLLPSHLQTSLTGMQDAAYDATAPAPRYWLAPQAPQGIPFAGEVSYFEQQNFPAAGVVRMHTCSAGTSTPAATAATEHDTPFPPSAPILPTLPLYGTSPMDFLGHATEQPHSFPSAGGGHGMGGVTDQAYHWPLGIPTYTVLGSLTGDPFPMPPTEYAYPPPSAVNDENLELSLENQSENFGSSGEPLGSAGISPSELPISTHPPPNYTTSQDGADTDDDRQSTHFSFT